LTGVDVRGVELQTNRSPRRLAGVSFAARPGELVAVIGASGAGKSTLLSVLAGLLAPTAGTGLVAGVDLAVPAARRAELVGTGRIGYVPQRDALHDELTVGQELGFAADLRHVGDAAERARRVHEVLETLEIAGTAGRRIRDLSGGERKRVSVAVELLAAPDVLLLDEATTGLDPVHERDLTRYLRTLADDGCTVVAATHSVVHLDQYDRILLLGYGGVPLFHGTPDEARAATGGDSFVDLFSLSRPLTGLSDHVPADRAEPDDPPAARARDTLRILIRRQLTRLVADRRTLWFLALQAPVLGLMVRAITGPDGLQVGAVGVNLYARRVLLVLVLCAVWQGSTLTVRDLVRDRDVLRRERIAGVRNRSVIAARLIVLWAASGLQVTALTVVGCAGIPGTTAGAIGKLIVGLWLCAGAAGCLALAISSFVRSTDQALAVLPLVLIPQLVLSGGVLALSDIPALRPLSYLSPARWGLSSVASAADLRMVETRTLVAVPLTAVDLHIAQHEDADAGWDPTGQAYAADLLGLLALALVGSGLSVVGLRRP
jgi:ABC-type multidrug transport system ATPase subunit